MNHCPTTTVSDPPCPRPPPSDKLILNLDPFDKSEEFIHCANVYILLFSDSLICILIIDKLLIIIKRAIILQRENKHTISIPTISSMISYQYNINQFNAKNNVQREKIRKQWSGLNSG